MQSALRFLVVAIGFSLFPAAVADACTSGVANSEVTADGRPLLWKVRMQANYPNVVHFYSAGVDNSGLGITDTYSYLAIEPIVADTPRMGVNSQGLVSADNYLNGGIESRPHYLALGSHSNLAGVRSLYASGQIDPVWHDVLFSMDASGGACVWEGTTAGGYSHNEYDTTATARDAQTHNGVNLSGWVVRDNTGHYRTDGSDNLSVINYSSRYAAGMAVTTNLIGANNLSAKTVMRDFARNTTLSPSTTISTMVVHGVLPTEDARLTTMWAALGYSRTTITTPVWVHGVESGAAGVVPEHLTYNAANPASNIAYVANHLRDTAVPYYTAIQARTVPFEAHLFDSVSNALLPSWRGRNDWNAIGQEMNRVSTRMSEDAHALLSYLDVNGASSDNAPTASLSVQEILGQGVKFDCTGFDDNDLDGLDDGTAVSLTWDYGGAGTLIGDTFFYDAPGTYLTSVTVTDNVGLSQTAWAIVSVPEPGTLALLVCGLLLAYMAKRKW